MFFFFVLIPCTLLFIAIAFLCIKSFSKGFYQLNTGLQQSNEGLKKSGRVALITSIIILALSGYLYWKYFWDQVWGFFEASFSNL